MEILHFDQITNEFLLYALNLINIHSDIFLLKIFTAPLLSSLLSTTLTASMAPSVIAIISTCVFILLYINFSNAVQSDIDCLRSFKASIEDPENFLTSWDFSNTTEGFICKFVGIECWHPDESRVLNINLSEMGLKGTLPLALQNCTSMTGLDLSSNNFFGNLPTNMTRILGFVTSLDLSSNNFSGTIPATFANLIYLNVLILGNNRFWGQIPSELRNLNRLKEFSVANNKLFGPVPNFQNDTEVSYGGNPGLCGGPLSPCPRAEKIA